MTRDPHVTVTSSSIAVDDADDDDDGHARYGAERQDQPPVREPTRHDVAQEYRTRVILAVGAETRRRSVATEADDGGGLVAGGGARCPQRPRQVRRPSHGPQTAVLTTGRRPIQKQSVRKPQRTRLT